MTRLTEEQLAEMERSPNLRRLVAEIRAERARGDFLRYTLRETADALEAAIFTDWEHERAPLRETLQRAREVLG